MTRPKWHEAWQDAFDEGFEEGEPVTHPAERKAIAVRKNADGTTTVVKTASGAEAEKMIADAQSRGMEVESNAEHVESLMAEQHGATDVPPEVMALTWKLYVFPSVRPVTVAVVPVLTPSKNVMVVVANASAEYSIV